MLSLAVGAQVWHRPLNLVLKALTFYSAKSYIILTDEEHRRPGKMQQRKPELIKLNVIDK
ncbi:MAG: hypothetical protein CMM53_01955 [Rhodospirillaceae bacterium]|nr:hypothetical protein [Rhodospirillaceae bacterium]